MSKELEKYSGGGVVSTSSISSQLESPSAEVMLTGGLKRKKKMEKADAKGIITTVDGKKVKVTGLTDKEKDTYLFGSGTIKKALDYIDEVTEYIEAHLAPELEDDFENTLEKCELSKTSALIKNKEGVWRRIRGRPCFICKDGTIHAGPKSFVGKKAATLRDELRAERKSKNSK